MLLGDAEDKVCAGDALPSLASPSKEKSWAAVVNGGGPTTVINMPPLEKKEVAETRRGNGKGRLDYSFIFTSLRSIWSGIADLRFTSVGKGMFLLCTSSEDDLKFILSPGRWYVGGRLLIANQWHPGMPMRIESSSRVRIWIRLPELPVEWWNPWVFTDIADLIDGAFVEADEYTRHLQRLVLPKVWVHNPLRRSCTLTEASKEGEKVAPNAWHLVKVPKRIPQPNKIKENLQLKQNKFEALSQLPEETADGVSSHDERQYASPAEKGQETTEFVVTKNAHASINIVSHDFQNGRAEGLDPKTSNPPKSTATGNYPNPLDGGGGRQQVDQDISMMGADQGSQEDFPLDEMETTTDEGKTGSHDLTDVQDGDLANTRLARWEGREHGQPCLKSNEKTGRAPALQACLALSNFVQQSALHEVSCPDMKFTWTNNRVGHGNVMSKNHRCYVFKESVDDPDNLLQLLVKSVNKTHITLLPEEPGLAMNISKSSLFSFNMDSRELNWIEHEIGWRQGRYCERKRLLDSSVRGKRVSHVWRRVLQSWRKVNENVGWKIGNGALAKFWTDLWGADRLMDKIPSSHIHLIHDTITCSVKELLEEKGEALMDYLAKLNIHFTCPPLQADQLDVMVWKNGENSEFNRHEIWQRVRKKGHHNKDYKLVWQGRLLPRASWTVYVGVSGRFPTDALVQQQGYSLASRCYVCKQTTEDVTHLFYDCKGARSLWSSIYGKFGRASPWCRSPPNLMQGHSSWHKKGFQDKSLDKCWKDSFHMAVCGMTNSPRKSAVDFDRGSSGAMESGLRISGLKSASLHGISRAEKQWRASLEMVQVRWPETEILSECLGHLANIADNMRRIYLLANDGEWKHHFLSHIGCRSDIVGNRALSNNFIDMLKVCKGWPLAEGSNLLMITPDNGLYTTWNPHETL
ncbi:hypothetical protein EJ110_NYTH25605 [Nymphaea thermarum]|nr:hypothetical protein EJ110_NYTH25605 [Nymphaea thermarum]